MVYDSDDTCGIKFHHRIFKVFTKIRESRLGSVNAILGVSEVGHVKNVLVIVPDERFDNWKEEFIRQGNKDVKREIFFHERPLPLLLNKANRDLMYKDANITLSKYSVIHKENEQLDSNHRPQGSKGQYEFFTKHWSLIIFHHAEQVEEMRPIAVKAANAALQLQGIVAGNRVYIFSREFLDRTSAEKLEMCSKKKAGKRRQTDDVDGRPAKQRSKAVDFGGNGCDSGIEESGCDTENESDANNGNGNGKDTENDHGSSPGSGEDREQE